MSAGKEREKLEEDFRAAAAPSSAAEAHREPRSLKAGLGAQPRLVRGEGGSGAPGVRRPVLGTARPRPGAAACSRCPQAAGRGPLRAPT